LTISGSVTLTEASAAMLPDTLTEDNEDLSSRKRLVNLRSGSLKDFRHRRASGTFVFWQYYP
jgi:hypothetical protein